MTMFHPDLLPQSADPEGSKRYENVEIMHIFIPNKSLDCINHWYEELKLFVIYDYSPENSDHAIIRFKGTVLEESDGTYSWWRNIQQGD